MIDYTLILIGGILGSTHCLGMCGPLALAVGCGERTPLANLRRQLVFSSGRIFTYAFLGAVAGYCGWWLNQRPDSMVNVQATMAVVSGIFLVVLGLITSGLLSPAAFSFLPQGLMLPSLCNTGGCQSGGWLKTFMASEGLQYAFLAGVFTGFLPCGLVYGFLALAASTSTLVAGMLTMVIFGIGTVPLMVIAGLGGSLFNYRFQQRVFQVAAYAVIVTGMITVARGAGFINWSGSGVAGCPLCTP